MSDLDKHRELTHRIFIALLWLHVPLNIVVCLLVDGPWLLLGSATAAAAALATATWRLSPNPLVVRATNAVALMVVISLLLAGMSGKAWQLDIHMYYFAALALVAIYCDPWAIIAAATVVAVSGNRSGIAKELRKAGALVDVDGASSRIAETFRKAVARS